MIWFQLFLLIFAKEVSAGSFCKTCSVGDTLLFNTSPLVSPVGSASNVSDFLKRHCMNVWSPAFCNGKCIAIDLLFERFGQRKKSAIFGCSNDFLKFNKFEVFAKGFFSYEDTVVQFNYRSNPNDPFPHYEIIMMSTENYKKQKESIRARGFLRFCLVIAWMVSAVCIWIIYRKLRRDKKKRQQLEQNNDILFTMIYTTLSAGMNWFQLLIVLVFINVVSTESFCVNCSIGNIHLLNTNGLLSPVGKSRNISDLLKTQCTKVKNTTSCDGKCIVVDLVFQRFGQKMLGALFGCSTDFIRLNSANPIDLFSDDILVDYKWGKVGSPPHIRYEIVLEPYVKRNITVGLLIVVLIVIANYFCIAWLNRNNPEDQDHVSLSELRRGQIFD